MTSRNQLFERMDDLTAELDPKCQIKRDIESKRPRKSATGKSTSYAGTKTWAGIADEAAKEAKRYREIERTARALFDIWRHK